jgi:hypothetical protein
MAQHNGDGPHASRTYARRSPHPERGCQIQYRRRTGFGVILIRKAFLADAIDNVLAQAALGLRVHRSGGMRREVAHTRRLHHILAT